MGSCAQLSVGTVPAYAGGRVRVPVDLVPNGNAVAALNYTAEWRAAAAAGQVTALESCTAEASTQAVDARHECVPDPSGAAVQVIIVDAGTRPVRALPHTTHLSTEKTNEALTVTPPRTLGCTAPPEATSREPSAKKNSG